MNTLVAENTSERNRNSSWWGSLGAVQSKKLSLPCWVLPKRMARIFSLSAVSIRERRLYKREVRVLDEPKLPVHAVGSEGTLAEDWLCALSFPLMRSFSHPPQHWALGEDQKLLRQSITLWAICSDAAECFPHHPLRFHGSTYFVVDTIFKYSGFYLDTSAQ